jgi:hypothetical protein
VDKYFRTKKIDDEVLSEQLHLKLEKFLKAVAVKDESAVREFAEKTFADKLLKSYQVNPNVKYQPESTEGDDLKAYIVDKMFIKGMEVDRSKNDTNFDYFYINSHEKEGLRIFSHKFNQGDHHYYYMRQFKEEFDQLTDRLHQEDPIAYFALRNDI